MLTNYCRLSEAPLPTELADRVRTLMTGVSPEDETLLCLCEEEVSAHPFFFSRSPAECGDYAKKVYSCLRCDLELLQSLADDDEISEIMVNGCDAVFVEKNGHIEKSNIKLDSKEQLISIIQRLAAKVGREMNDLNPIVDARLSDGSRINAVNDNVAIVGPILTIRKFGKVKMTMEDLIERGDSSQEAADFLRYAVEKGCNIFISGGTSSGKTSFLNVLSECIPENERIIVIEDSAELQIRNHENMIRMEAKQPNSQGKGAVTIRELIKASLRMRPDRIVVGEVRGEEVIDMLAAMSTGHDGSLSTGHANSPRGMLGRLETLHISSSGFPLTAVRNQIADAIDVIVQLKRYPDGHRRVTHIDELCGIKEGEYELNPLFEREDGGDLERTGNPVRNKYKLKGLQRLQSRQD